MNRELKSIVIAIVTVGAAWWLLKRLQNGGLAIAFETRTPEAAGLRTPCVAAQCTPCAGTQHMEHSIDDMIEASFPASDPSAWTPVAGTGRLSR